MQRPGVGRIILLFFHILAGVECGVYVGGLMPLGVGQGFSDIIRNLKGEVSLDPEPAGRSWWKRQRKTQPLPDCKLDPGNLK